MWRISLLESKNQPDEDKFRMQEHDKNHIFHVSRYFLEFFVEYVEKQPVYSLDQNLSNRFDITAQRVR